MGKHIVVLGGGGHARVLAAILRDLAQFTVVGYTAPQDQGLMMGTPYLGTDASLAALAARGNDLQAALGIGQLRPEKLRQALWMQCKNLGFGFPSIIAPSAVVREKAEIGEATVIFDKAVVNVGAVIGNGAILNTHCTVEHDCTIGDWVHLAPGSTLCGHVRVGAHSMIGAGATVIEGIEIAGSCLIGAGATVVQDLIEPGVYVGCPAHRVK